MSEEKNVSLLSLLYTQGYPSTWEMFFAENLTELKKISENLVDVEQNNVTIYPELHNVFRAFIPISDIKLVILGMDPYFNGSATGLCFSVKKGNVINASLRNIYSEIKRGGETLRKEDGDLEHWKEQGCFMLNTALTVEKGKAGSHIKLWKTFTTNVLKHVIQKNKDCLFLLMGNPAIETFEFCLKDGNVVSENRVFKTTHPSPLGASKDSRLAKAFVGSSVFRRINEKLGERRIEW